LSFVWVLPSPRQKVIEMDPGLLERKGIETRMDSSSTGVGLGPTTKRLQPNPVWTSLIRWRRQRLVQRLGCNRQLVVGLGPILSLSSAVGRVVRVLKLNRVRAPDNPEDKVRIGLRRPTTTRIFFIKLEEKPKRPVAGPRDGENERHLEDLGF